MAGIIKLLALTFNSLRFEIFFDFVYINCVGGIMKKLFGKGLILIAVIGLFFILADPVSSQVSKLSLKKASLMKINGGCSISIRPYDRMLSPTLLLKVDGKPLTKMQVTVDGVRIPETEPGRYRKTIYDYSVVPGKTINILIKPPAISTLKAATAMKEFKASAVVKQPMSFISPKPDAKVRIRPNVMLRVEWSPGTGTGPYRCYIYEFRAPKVLGKMVYESGDIFTTKVSVATTIFKPNKQYGVYIFRKMGDFRYRARIAPGSHLSLSHSVGTYIHTK